MPRREILMHLRGLSPLLLALSLAAAACADEPEPAVDLDGDGYVAGTAGGDDCDDTNVAVSPGALERCDGLDNDCDGEVDEEPVDGVETFADADADGFGDPASAALQCAVEDGRVFNDLDCADDDPDRSPDAVDLCDGVDNDCDGAIDDGLRVPDDVPSLQAALDAATDGDRICLAPGTWTGPFDFGETEVTIASTGSSEDTVLEGDSAGPVVTIAGGQRAGTGLIGVTVSGAQGSGGAGIRARGAAFTLQDVVIDGATCEDLTCRGVGIHVEDAPAPMTWRDVAFDGLACRGATCEGAGLWADGVDLRIDGLRATDVTYRLTGCDTRVEGGVVRARGEHTRLVLQDVAVEGFSAWPAAGGLCRARTLQVYGGIVAADHIRSVAVRDATFDGVDYALTDGARTSQRLLVEGGVLATGMVDDVTLERVALRGLSTATSEDGTPADRVDLYGGAVYTWSYDAAASLTVEDLVFEASTVSAYQVVGGLLRISDVEADLRGMDVSDVVLTSERDLRGGLLEVRGYEHPLALEGLTVRDSRFESTVRLVEGGLIAGSTRRGGRLSDVTVHDVEVSAEHAVRGGLFNLSDGFIDYEDLDLVDNRFTSAGRDVLGAVMNHRSADVRLTRVRMAGNQVEAATVLSGLSYDVLGSARWDNVIAVGNTLASTRWMRGGVAYLNGSTLDARNVSTHGNTLSSELNAVEGGFAYLNGSRDSYLALQDSDVSAQRHEADEVRGGVVYAAGEASAEVSWCNIGEPAGAFFGLEPGPGMLQVDPGYQTTTGAPADWDLTLTPASPLRDAGDPDRLDADGSRVDLGAHGGPDGQGW